ncbi:hypothetical protein A3H09_00185 [Candidatus Falkowbacteria bacterium RIFCSPLOWO2_12_FULL_45_13]|uniref:Tetratricopeptide repeat protein n=2 Tax=Bacteria TaxID=2 RepID=A0A1F4RAV2_UNCSA|nr:MAG: hypothetical protein A3H38_02485 [candidate division WOR-1 bacterium RIFCSPLOWO2_02_FULL_46_20]OGF32099.1 MAG: hypothetical protein A3H09_00185 [Candidatus Falkowbacteria bacterium RIFCSPLOWO2_12_FULL_45_13]
MAVLSPVMSYIVDKQVGFPIPSEKEKINKVLKRYRYILSQNPKRADAPELMFGIADLLVGRSEQGDYKEAKRIFDQILERHIPDSLRARTLIGKAELMIGSPEAFDEAISLCEKARKLLGNDMSDFFAAKTFAVEAELRLARKNKGDWDKALKLLDHVIRAKNAHWYFKGRAFLTKTEIKLYQTPKDTNNPLRFAEAALKELKPRSDDYFTYKGKTLKAEVLIRRAKRGDFDRAEKLLESVISMPFDYQDLIFRAKLDMADIVKQPKATKLVKEVLETEGLDPYLMDKARIVEIALAERRKQNK